MQTINTRRVRRVILDLRGIRPVRRPNYNPTAAVSSDWQLLGCLANNELFNGVSAARAILAPKDKTLCEDWGIPAHSTANEWYATIDDYIAGRADYETVHARMEKRGRP
jgi:hypothetical protein